MESVNIISSFLAGLLIFLAPCTLPIVPGYISFISYGDKNKAVRNAVLFSAGFLVVFLLFGILASLFGYFLAPYKLLLQKIGGILVVVLGLHILGIFNISFFNSNNLSQKVTRFYKTKWGPFLFGSAFALGWSPCVGPVLAGIFFYASFSFSALKAVWLFLFFGLGFVLPFVFISFLVKRGKSVKLKSYKIFNTLSGLLLVFLGVLIFMDNFGSIISFFYKVLGFINYEAIENLL